MSVTSVEYVLFLFVTVISYYLLPHKYQWILLTVASVSFYILTCFRCIPYILITSMSAYLAGLLIGGEAAVPVGGKSRGKRGYKKAIMITVLILNFGILFVLKYIDAALLGADRIFHLTNSGYEIPQYDVLLPVGISFYTFQTMGYIIDVYRNKADAEKNYFKLLLFVSFFPQLIQGPISRHDELAEQLYEGHEARWKNISSGMLRVVWGYFKKLVIADTLAIVSKSIIEYPESFGGGYVTFLIVVYTAQLYNDFSGGMDIAIGTGEMLGIEMRENFNRPFASTSVKEYWKRWHITLGAWFQNYVFYPLSICLPMQKLSKKIRSKFGRSFARRIPVYIATLFTWLLTGMWHGAGANFAVWGLLNATVMLISMELDPLYSRFAQFAPRVHSSYAYTLFCRVRTFFLIGAIRLLDCYRNVGETFSRIFSIFTDAEGWRRFVRGGFLRLGMKSSEYFLILLCLALVLFVSSYRERAGSPLRYKITERPRTFFLCVGALFVAIVIFGNYGLGFEGSNFIYNQF
ncbi:MAG: MBOAT family protein [Ruminococcaceae bacterium]|nr:MBOAT family protein [Oscillospiraceae bacterium]